MENKTPFFSVVIPVYNAEKTLTTCVNSILVQNFKDYEILLINDGSTDSSLGICEDLKKNHPSVRLYTQYNKGASAARNLGIKEAKGQYICFVDSDDTVAVNYLPALWEASKNKQSDLIVLGVRTIRDSGETKHLPKKASGVRITEDISLFLEEVQNTYPYSKIYKRLFLLKNNLLFCEELVLWEDSDFTFRALSVCRFFSSVSLPLYEYHLYSNNESITRSGHTRAYQDSLLFLHNMDNCNKALHWENNPEMLNYRLHVRRSMAYGHFMYIAAPDPRITRQERFIAFKDLMETNQLREDVLFLLGQQHSLAASPYVFFLKFRFVKGLEVYVHIKNKWLLRKGRRA